MSNETWENFEHQLAYTEIIDVGGKTKIQCNACGSKVLLKDGAYTKHFRGKAHTKKFNDMIAAEEAEEEEEPEPEEAEPEEAEPEEAEPEEAEEAEPEAAPKKKKTAPKKKAAPKKKKAAPKKK